MALPRRHPPPTPFPLATRGQTQLQFHGTCNGSGCVRGSGRGRVDTLAIQISFIIAIPLRGLLDCFAYRCRSPQSQKFMQLRVAHSPPPLLPSLPMRTYLLFKHLLIMFITFISCRCWFSTSIFALKLRRWERRSCAWQRVRSHAPCHIMIATVGGCQTTDGLGLRPISGRD